jgi:putrescine transport system substrate-binding protein
MGDAAPPRRGACHDQQEESSMRIVHLTAAAISVIILAAPALAQEKVVNVYNWSDYIDPQVLEDFTKETGIKVVYDTMDSNEVLETKLLAGKTGYDVVVPTGSFLQRQIKAGIYLPLDKSKLPNLQYAWDKVFNKLAVYDPGNKYAVNYMWGTTGIGYNATKAKERMGDQPMNTWEVIFKPENISKFQDCGIHMLDAPEELLPAALDYLELSPDSKDPKDIQKAGELLQTIRPYIKKFHSSEYVNALANGDICLVVGWSGDVFQAKNRAVEAHAKSPDKALVDVEYVIPKEGALMWFDSMAIPKDAAHVDEAYAFINYMMRPDVAAKNSNFVSYANGNIASQAKINDAVKGNPEIYPDEAMMAKLYTVTSYDPKVQRVVTRVWTKFKTGQ